VRPLELTLQRMSESDEVNLVLAGKVWPPPGHGWFVLSDVLRNSDLASGWVGHLLSGQASGRRDVAGSYLSASIAGMVAGIPAGAVIAAGRAWPLEPSGIALHLHADGWFDGMALKSPALWVLPDDPDAGDADSTVFPSAGDLRDRLASEIVRVLNPIFAAVRSATGYPARSMWGLLADGIAGMALWRDRSSGTLDPDVWERAVEVIDALQERVRLMKARPTLAEVTSGASCVRFAVKGTCCLYFKTFDGNPDPDGEGYCSSCPLRSDASRHRRWAAWLDEQDATI
jgi:hypothetical protein